jgi:hypothetical protein
MTYRILSLDGGGTWAMLQARALADLYPAKSGREVLADFDLAVANSGGAIVLAGLMLDMHPADIAGLFRMQAASIFVPGDANEWVADKLHLPMPKFSMTEKRKGLQAALPDGGLVQLDQWDAPKARSGEAVRAMITAFNYDTLRAVFFRTFRSANGQGPSTSLLVDAIHASANPPVVFFDAPAVDRDGCRYWDGAVAGYNNPLMTAIVEGLAARKVAAEIQVLSIGTGTVHLAPWNAPDTAAKLCQKHPDPHFWDDLPILAGSILDDPPDAANYVAFNVLGNQMPMPAPTAERPIHSGSLVRLSPIVQPKHRATAPGWDPPAGYSVESFDKLANMDLASRSDEAFDALETLWARWKSGDMPNQPVLADHETYEPTIGDATYEKGKRRWLAM